MTERFHLFWSGPFSQWAKTPFVLDGVRYRTAEQYMMAEKARLFGDAETLAEIMAAKTPYDQKRLGRLVRGFDKDRWEAVAQEVVHRGNVAKFEQNPGARRALLATGDRTIVEASPEDQIWGIGIAEDDPRALDRSQWRGTNWLGDVLMRVRGAILVEYAGP